MSTDTEALNAIARLKRRVESLERSQQVEKHFLGEVVARLVVLEKPIAQVLENPKSPLPPEPIICPECGGLDIGSKGCTAILPDRGIQHRCRSCEHYWRVTIKGNLPGPEEHDKLFRIVYRHGKFDAPYFTVRAMNSTIALMEFIAKTTEMHIDAIYDVEIAQPLPKLESRDE